MWVGVKPATLRGLEYVNRRIRISLLDPDLNLADLEKYKDKYNG